MKKLENMLKGPRCELVKQLQVPTRQQEECVSLHSD